MIGFVLYHLFIIAALISVPAFIQASMFEAGKRINHTLWAACLGILYAVYLFADYSMHKINAEAALWWFTFFVAARFACFDYLLNYLREKDVHYLGNESKTDQALTWLQAHGVNLLFFRTCILMLAAFGTIGATAEYFNQEHNTALVVLTLIIVSGAIFLFNYFSPRKPGQL